MTSRDRKSTQSISLTYFLSVYKMDIFEVYLHPNCKTCNFVKNFELSDVEKCENIARKIIFRLFLFFIMTGSLLKREDLSDSDTSPVDR